MEISDAEIAYCISLFDEEIAVNDRITAENMRSCLLAMGEIVRIKTIMRFTATIIDIIIITIIIIIIIIIIVINRYFKHFSSDSESRFIVSFQEFMYVVYGIKMKKIDSTRINSNISCCYKIIDDFISLLRDDGCYCNYCNRNPYWQPLPKPQCQHYYAQQQESKKLKLDINQWEQIYCEILDTYVYRKLNINSNTDSFNMNGLKNKKNKSDYVFRWDAPVEVNNYSLKRNIHIHMSITCNHSIR